ncbi:PfkB family carbohydrate kinase, partial [uncultured Paracoccus sp.]
RPLPGDFFAELLQGAWDRGLPERADFVLTGYIGSIEVARLIADFVAKAKAVNPRLRYYCDPVLGDEQPGLYVPKEIADIFRDRLLPMADIASPNPFEIAWLTGQPIAELADVHHAAEALHMAPEAQLIVTGCKLRETAPGMLESVIRGPDGLTRHPTPHLPVAMAGTGDLFAGLITAALGQGRSLAQAVEFAQVQTSRALARAAELGTKEVVLSDPEFRAALLRA